MGSHCMGHGRFQYSNSDFECEYHSRGELSNGFQVSNVPSGKNRICGVVALWPKIQIRYREYHPDTDRFAEP